MAYRVIPSFSLSSMTCWRSALSCDSPSVITIITFLAPRRPPCLKAWELWKHISYTLSHNLEEGRWISVAPLHKYTRPCHFDAKSCVGLFSTSLIDAACSFHHFLNRFVVTEFELMDHLLTILKHSNLSNEPQWFNELTIEKRISCPICINYSTPVFDLVRYRTSEGCWWEKPALRTMGR